jgi:hypothetical protein
MEKSSSALYLPTFSHYLIVNKASFSLSLSPPPPTPQARNLAFILRSSGFAPMLNGVKMIIVLFICSFMETARNLDVSDAAR